MPGQAQTETQFNRSRRGLIKLSVGMGLYVGLPKFLLGDTPAQTKPDAWRATGQEIPALVSFEKLMRDFMHARSIPAGALAVARHKQLLFARAYTAPDEATLTEPSSLFRIASLSKPLTATAVHCLVQEKRLDLSDKLTDILSLDPCPANTPDERLGKVTVGQLLQHLGGWDRKASFDPMFRDRAIAETLNTTLPISQGQIITYMNSQPLQHAPGTRYAYSNYGYCLLGQIIARLTQGSYQDYVQQAVLSPLGITRARLGRTLPQYRQTQEVKYHSQKTGKTVHDASAAVVSSPYGAWNLENMAAHGGWLASAVDMVRFAVSFDDPEANPVLRPAAVKTMFAPPENIEAHTYQAGDAYYGCGWSVRDWGPGQRNIWHTGSLPGTQALLVKRWQDTLTWCVLFNQRDDPSGLSYKAIDGLLHRAANQVKQWPDHDLFAGYF